LNREDLLYNYSIKWNPDESRPLVKVTPTASGAELFMWGHGIRPPRANAMTDPAITFRFLTEVPATPSAALKP
jgi:hypothetical protein